MCAGTSEVRIVTERLVLRPPTHGDAVYIAELANDAEVARMTTRVRHPYRLMDAEAFLGAMEQADPRRDRVFVLDHPDFGPIGLAGAHRSHDRIPEFGYWLGRTFRGRGFATEAAAAVVAWVGESWARGLLAGHFADNPASARVLEKAGFLYTGEVRSRFSLGRGQEVATRMMVWLA